MKRFNLYSALAIAAALACGCQTPEGKKDKQMSTLRVHLEVHADQPDRCEVVSVCRSTPIEVNIEKKSFLDEGNVTGARIVDVPGGFEIEVHYDKISSWLLEEYTTANHGRRLAIFARFAMSPEEKLNAGRWIAAPKIARSISNGTLMFTPDATRAESEQIVLGLNNFARQQKKDSKWW